MLFRSFAARGRGRGFSILKPFSQITIVIRQMQKDSSPKNKNKDAAQADRPKKTSKKQNQPTQPKKRAA